MAIFHDLLTPEEMQFMQFSIMSEMKVSTVQDITNPQGGATKVTWERTQASGWLWDEESELLLSVSRRISAATGLAAHSALPPAGARYYDTAEPWQIGVYSPGGHYLPHHDDFDVLDPQAYTKAGTWVGNRAATAMAYLSHVEGEMIEYKRNNFTSFYHSGGLTAFPNIGVAARPQMGSVVFWYSLDTEGARYAGL